MVTHCPFWEMLSDDHLKRTGKRDFWTLRWFPPLGLFLYTSLATPLLLLHEGEELSSVGLWGLMNKAGIGGLKWLKFRGKEENLLGLCKEFSTARMHIVCKEQHIAGNLKRLLLRSDKLWNSFYYWLCLGLRWEPKIWNSEISGLSSQHYQRPSVPR